MKKLSLTKETLHILPGSTLLDVLGADADPTSDEVRATKQVGINSRKFTCVTSAGVDCTKIARS